MLVKQETGSKTVTYSPCKTMESSISTFLLEVLVRGADRGRFIDVVSVGVGFTFKTEDFLPTAETIHLYIMLHSGTSKKET